jgi:hypothetical protein
MTTQPLSPAGHSVRMPGRFYRSCPHCGSREIHRSRARGIIERHIVSILRFYPHRCESCDSRFYMLVTGKLSH